MNYFKFSPIILIFILILSNISVINAEPTNSNTIYVSMSGNDSNDGLTPTHAKKTVVNAVETADNGDIIQIAPGTYQEDGIVIDKKLTLKGEDPKTTIIQGKEKGYGTIVVNLDGDVLIQKLTITKAPTKKKNRGIHNLGFLTVEDSIIKDNNADAGAGIQNLGFLTLKRCEIKNNTVDRNGGGISNYEGTLVVEDSFIVDNKAAHYGAGIHTAGGDVTIRNTVITGNEATGYLYLGGFGGGISSCYGNLVLQNSSITNNKARYGGGLYIEDTNVVLDGSRIIGNYASVEGGGLYRNKINHIKFINSVIRDNKPNNIHDPS